MRPDKPVEEADTLQSLAALLEGIEAAGEPASPGIGPSERGDGDRRR